MAPISPMEAGVRTRTLNDGDLATRERIQAEKILVFAAGSPRNLLSGVAAALVIAVTLSLFRAKDGGKLIQWIWLACLSGILIRGAWISHSLSRNRNRTRMEVMAAGHKLTWNGLIAAVFWGITSWVFLPDLPIEGQAFLITCIAMVLMGGAGAQAAYRPVVLVFCLATTIVFASGLLRVGELYHRVMAIAYPIYCFVILNFARFQEAAIETQIQLKMERESALLNATNSQSEAERARTQAERSQAEADAANRAKTRFIGAVSHDLRQPLHALEQYVGGLEDELGTTGKYAKLIGLIRQSLDSAQTLLNSVLEWSRISAGAVKPIFDIADVREIMERIDSELRPFAETKGLHFSVGSRAAVGFVRTDQEMLQRVLRNLILNAIRYTGSGRVAIRCRRRQSHIRFQVFDTGIGIARSELEKIYDPFYQVANTSRDRSKGMGLGLSIVKEFCGLLNVRLRVRSVMGKGTAFLIDVPAADVPSKSVGKPLSTIPSQDLVKGAFVVLVDDDSLSRDATASTLKTFGCRVVAAASGLDAIAALQDQEFKPDIMVADYRLEDGETGLSAIKLVRENLRALYGAEFDLPAFLISGDVEASEIEIVRDSRMSIIHKPVRREKLFEQLNQLLQ